MFSNDLTAAQQERLALLTEELAEAIQAVGKIQRHGYESSNPLISNGPTNRRELEKEIGDVYFSVQLMFDSGDMDQENIIRRVGDKAKLIKPYLHHQ